MDDLVAEPGLVVLMCGIAGSGKSTYARALERRGFVRLSVDEAVWQRLGHEPASRSRTARASASSSSTDDHSAALRSRLPKLRT